MQLYSPLALLLLLGLPVMGWLLLRRGRPAAIKFPSLDDMKNCPVSWRIRLRPVLIALRLLLLALLIVAIARPRKGTVLSEIATEGVAIEILADRSGSMQAEMSYEGQTLNRLEVVKKVLADFIKGDKKGFSGRSSDLIGLIIYARYADTLCPLVLSHNVLLEFLRNTQIVTQKSEDGTAIGDGIALAAARLKNAEQEIVQRKTKLGLSGGKLPIADDFRIKSKAIILLTDGRNNTGQYDPLAAAKLAKEWDIKIYTIGIGSGQSYTTIQTLMGAFKMPTAEDLDEGLLKKIAEITGGFYSKADDAKALKEIVEKIDSAEKTEVRSIQYTQYAEHFSGWALAALAALMLEILGSCTIFRKIP